MHWALLQSVAWVGMVVTYSQDSTLSEAIQKTFGGNYPCKMCTEIAKAKKTEKKSDVQIEGKKLEFFDVREVYVFIPPQLFYLLNAGNDSALPVAVKPPVPPPRAA